MGFTQGQKTGGYEWVSLGALLCWHRKTVCFQASFCELLCEAYTLPCQHDVMFLRTLLGRPCPLDLR